MIRFLKSIKDINCTDSSKHEKIVELELILNGFDPVDKDYRPDIGEKCFVAQPNGSQKFPDFLVFDDHTQFTIECKASKTGYIKWNGGFPVKNAIYIYSNTKSNKTTFLLGQAMAGDETIKRTRELWDKINELNNQYMMDIKNLKDNHHFIYPKPRKDHQNSHAIFKCEKSIKRQEKAVLEYVETFNGKLERYS